MTTDIVVVALRALAFIAVIQTAGCAICCIYFGAQLDRDGRDLRRISSVAAGIAIALVAIQHFMEPARMTASLSGVRDLSLQLLLLQSDAGTARALRILGLVIIAISALRAQRFRRSLLPIGATIALASFLLMGHTEGHSMRWLLAILLFMHLAIAAFWIGALTTFLVSASRGPEASLGQMVVSFSRDAGWLVPVIGVAGLAMAYVLLPDLAALATPYGILLVAKLAAFGVLMMLAAWNKYRLAPAMARGSQQAAENFRRVVAIEWVLLALVLAATAVMTGLFGPNSGVHQQISKTDSVCCIAVKMAGVEPLARGRQQPLHLR